MCMCACVQRSETQRQTLRVPVVLHLSPDSHVKCRHEGKASVLSGTNGDPHPRVTTTTPPQHLVYVRLPNETRDASKGTRLFSLYTWDLASTHREYAGTSSGFRNSIIITPTALRQRLAEAASTYRSVGVSAAKRICLSRF